MKRIDKKERAAVMFVRTSRVVKRAAAKAARNAGLSLNDFVANTVANATIKQNMMNAPTV